MIRRVELAHFWVDRRHHLGNEWPENWSRFGVGLKYRWNWVPFRVVFRAVQHDCPGLRASKNLILNSSKIIFKMYKVFMSNGKASSVLKIISQNNWRGIGLGNNLWEFKYSHFYSGFLGATTGLFYLRNPVTTFQKSPDLLYPLPFKVFGSGYSLFLDLEPLTKASPHHFYEVWHCSCIIKILCELQYIPRGKEWETKNFKLVLKVQFTNWSCELNSTKLAP